MKRTIVLAGVVLTAFAFNGCNNEAALKEAQDKYNSQLTATTDSLRGAAQVQLDTVKAQYDRQLQVLNDSIATLNATLEATAKKAGGTVKPKADPKTAGMDQKQKESYEQKKAKMGGK